MTEGYAHLGQSRGGEELNNADKHKDGAEVATGDHGIVGSHRAQSSVLGAGEDDPEVHSGETHDGEHRQAPMLQLSLADKGATKLSKAKANEDNTLGGKYDG